MAQTSTAVATTTTTLTTSADAHEPSSPVPSPPATPSTKTTTLVGSAEAALWARELLDDILEDVASTDTLLQRCPSEDLAPNRVLEPLLQALALRPVNKTGAAAAVVTNTIRSANAAANGGGGICRVMEVRTLQQHKNGSCGYYALHNAMLVLHALRAPTDAAATMFLEELHHRGSLWRDFSRLHRRLEDKVREEGCPPHRYPWGERVVRTAVLERSHLNHLLRPGVFPELTSLGGADTFTKLSELDWDTACALHEVFQRIRSPLSGPKAAHAFIVGDWNHWFSIVAHRIGAGHFELVVLDSLNRGVTLVLDPSDEDNGGHTTKVDTLVSQSRSQLTDEEYRMALLCRENACGLIRLIARCLLGDMDVRDHCVGNVVNEMLESFHVHCLQEPYARAPPGMEAPADRKERFLNWLSNFYPPPVLHNVLREVQTHSDEATRARLRGWAKAVRDIGLELDGDKVAEVLQGFNKSRSYVARLVAEASTCVLKSGGG